MAYSQGVCANCGSLIQMNPAQDTARCIFCWSQTPTKQALALLENKEGHTFANAEIGDAPPFEERLNYWRLEVGDNSPAKNAVKQKVQKEKVQSADVAKPHDALSAVERIKRMKFDLLKVPDVSWKNRILLALGLVILPVAAVLALYLPPYLRRIDTISRLKAQINTVVPQQLLANGDVENAVAFNNYAGNELRVVVSKPLHKEDLLDIGKKYFKLYNSVKGAGADEEVKVEVLQENASHSIYATAADKIELADLERTK